MLVSFCPFPIVLGRPDATPLQSSGAAVATSPRAGAHAILAPVDGVPVRYYADPTDVVGLPSTLPDGAEGAVVPLAVAAAMRAGAHKRTYRLFSPAPLREEGGVRYAPHLVFHDDLLLEQEGPR